MGVKRLEAEIRALSRRLSKLEARKEGSVPRSSRTKPIESPSDPRPPDGQSDSDQPADSSEPGTIEFRSTAAFEEDLGALGLRERQRVINAINAKCPLWLEDRRKAEKQFARPYRFLLRGELESSLCEIRAGKERRVIMAVDDDPIFGRVNVTLMRVVLESERKAAYLELGELLYPGRILEVQTSEGP